MKYASSAIAVPPDFAGLAFEQGRASQDIRPHNAGAINRSPSRRQNTSDVQTVQRSDG